MIRYAITDRRAVPGDEADRRRALLHHAVHLAQQGVNYLQLREKDLLFAEAAALAAELQTAVEGRARVLLNAAWQPGWPEGVGLHLSSAALRALAATGQSRAELCLPGLVSAACHALEDVPVCRRFADLLLFAPVFEKRVAGARVVEGADLQRLAQVCRAAAPVPVLAMGGVTPANATLCMNAGAGGIAGIRLFAPPPAASEGEVQCE